MKVIVFGKTFFSRGLDPKIRSNSSGRIVTVITTVISNNKIMSIIIKSCQSTIGLGWAFLEALYNASSIQPTTSLSPSSLLANDFASHFSEETRTIRREPTHASTIAFVCQAASMHIHCVCHPAPMHR